MVGLAGAQNDRCDGWIGENPCDGQNRQLCALLVRYFTDFLDRRKLALVPVPGLIHCTELTHLCRETTLVRLIAVFIPAAQKSPSERIERNHRKAVFLRQWQQFALNLPEKQIVARLDGNKTYQPQCVLPSKRFCQAICVEV